MVLSGWENMRICALDIRHSYFQQSYYGTGHNVCLERAIIISLKTVAGQVTFDNLANNLLAECKQGPGVLPKSYD